MTHPLDPPPEVLARLDQLAAASKDAPGDDGAYLDLLRALFALERWICIARGADEQPSPLAVDVPMGPTVLVFSTAERARETGARHGLPPEEAARLLATPMPATVDWLASMQELGITGVLMDHGTIGAYLPTAKLQEMRDWFAQHPGA